MWKKYVCNPATCSCENGKCLASIVHGSAIICDEVIEAESKAINKETKTFPANFNEKKASCKMQNFYILFTFY